MASVGMAADDWSAAMDNSVMRTDGRCFVASSDSSCRRLMNSDFIMSHSVSLLRHRASFAFHADSLRPASANAACKFTISVVDKEL